MTDDEILVALETRVSPSMMPQGVEHTPSPLRANEVVHRLRERGLTIAQIAEEAGVETWAVISWLVGRRRHPEPRPLARLEMFYIGLLTGERRMPRKRKRNLFAPHRIRAILEKHNLSVYELSRICGTAERNVYRWLQGEGRPAEHSGVVPILKRLERSRSGTPGLYEFITNDKLPAERVREIIAASGLTNERIAQLCGVLEREIYRWKAGELKPGFAASKILLDIEAETQKKTEPTS